MKKSFLTYFLIQAGVYFSELTLFTIMVSTSKIEPVSTNVFCKFLAAVSSFYLNRAFTFKDALGGNIHNQAFRYIVAIFFNTLISTTLLYALNDFLGVHVSLAKFASDAVVFLVSYYVSKNIVYKS